MEGEERGQHPQESASQAFPLRQSRQDRRFVEKLPWWRSSLVGYLLCPFLTGMAAIVDLTAKLLSFNLYTTSAPFYLANVLIAWLWGVGPALLGMVFGFLLLALVIIPLYGGFTFNGWGNVVTYLPLIAAQFFVILIIAQRERARREAFATAQELIRVNDHLEQLTSDLAEINQLKDYFLSQASHELKTPITTIRAQTQLILRRLTRPQQRVLEPSSLSAYLERIEEQTCRLQTLIEDLLDISSLNSGKIPLRLASCDLTVLCRNIIEDQNSLSDHRIELEHPSEPLILQADAQRLTQVIINLVSNAMKYSPENSIVRVCASREANNITLKVHNDGSVIPQEQQMHIFEPFYRATKAERSSIQGSGLGLAISKEIVEQHDGQISVESSEEKGTTFFVRLPFNT